MIKGLIWDLDNTLVDTSISEPYRKLRKWDVVYNLIPSFTLYSGIREVLSFCHEDNYRTCVVTSSSSKYAKQVLNYFNIPSEFLVDYFSAKIKPSPDPMLLALRNFGLNPDQVISIGDRAIDIEASRAAGIKSIGCTWGTTEEPLLINSKPTYLISSPIEIIPFISS